MQIKIRLLNLSISCNFFMTMGMIKYKKGYYNSLTVIYSLCNHNLCDGLFTIIFSLEQYFDLWISNDFKHHFNVLDTSFLEHRFLGDNR